MKDSYIFYTDKLGKDYLQVFEKVEMYMLSQNIDERTREERMNELLDVFISAEQAGKPPEAVTGKNLELFCKTFCSDLGFRHSILFVVDWLKSVAWMLLIESVINILFYLSERSDGEAIDLMYIPGTLNLSGYIIGMMIAGIMSIVSNNIIGRIMFRKKRISIRILKGASYAVAVLSFVIIFLCLSISKTDIFDYSSFSAAGISAAYLIGYYLFRKRDRRPKVKFSEFVNNMPSEIPPVMEKKYAKANSKSIKRGNGELPIEKFLEKEEKGCRSVEKFRIFYFLLPLIIMAASFVSTYSTGGFDGIADIILYLLIMFAIEYFIINGLWKITEKNNSDIMKWIGAKRRELDSEKSCASSEKSGELSTSVPQQSGTADTEKTHDK